jgi:hypothetical protein
MFGSMSLMDFIELGLIIGILGYMMLDWLIRKEY